MELLSILLLFGYTLAFPIGDPDYESGILDTSTWDLVQNYERAKAQLHEDRLAGVNRRAPVATGQGTESPLPPEGLAGRSGSDVETGGSDSFGHSGPFLATDNLVSLLLLNFVVLALCKV